MHIRLMGRELAGGLKWRGGTLVDFDGRRWSNPNATRRAIPVCEMGRPSWNRRITGRGGVTYTIEFDELGN